MKSQAKYLINGVDTKLFSQTKVKKEKFTYGYIGSFSKEKNLPLLVRAYAHLPVEILKNTQLVLVGANPPDCCNDCKMAASELNLEIAKYNSSCNITIKSYIPISSPEYAVSEFNSFNVTVLASAQEGCPNMILESLSCGVPVLFFAGAQEITEVATDEVSSRFNELTTQGLTKALEKAYSDSAKQSGTSRDYAIRNFDLSETISKTIDFLR